jgi:hypothetical protein
MWSSRGFGLDGCQRFTLLFTASQPLHRSGFPAYRREAGRLRVVTKHTDIATPTEP